MKVYLRNNWFAPNGQRFRRSRGRRPVEIPENYREFLPKSAEVIEDGTPSKVLPPIKESATLTDFDIVRTGVRSFGHAMAKADEQEAENRKVRQQRNK